VVYISVNIRAGAAFHRSLLRPPEKHKAPHDRGFFFNEPSGTRTLDHRIKSANSGKLWETCADGPARKGCTSGYSVITPTNDGDANYVPVYILNAINAVISTGILLV